MERINDLLTRLGIKKFPELIIKEEIIEVIKKHLALNLTTKDISFNREIIIIKVNNQVKARLLLLSNIILTDLNNRLKNTNFTKIS